MRVGKLEVEFSNNHLWVTATLDPDGENMTVREDWQEVPDEVVTTYWDMYKMDILQDVGRRLIRSEGARLN